MQTVAETPTFTQQADRLFSDAEKAGLIEWLATHPDAGAIIKDTGGIRKARYAIPGRGKRGGARVIYFYMDETVPLYALSVYAKNVRVDLTADQKRALSKMAADIKKAARTARKGA